MIFSLVAGTFTETLLVWVCLFQVRCWPRRTYVIHSYTWVYVVRHRLYQSFSISRWCCRFLENSYRSTSSAKIVIVVLIVLGISAVQSRKSSGPRTLSCGTSELIGQPGFIHVVNTFLSKVLMFFVRLFTINNNNTTNLTMISYADP